MSSSWSFPPRHGWRGPPLAFQILGLLIGGLVVAQLVTLLLTMILPPPPPAQYGLDAIAAMLRDGAPAPAGGRTLRRQVQAGPPDLSGPGWLVSERSRRDLARLAAANEADVSLAFYTPLPFAGSAFPPPRPPMADDGPIFRPSRISSGDGTPPARLILAQASAGPPPGPPPRLDPPSRPGGFGPPPRDGFPPGTVSNALPSNLRPDASRPFADAPLSGGGRPPGGNGLYAVDPAPLPGNGIYIPGDGGAAVPPLLQRPDQPLSPPPQTLRPPPPIAAPAQVRPGDLGPRVSPPSAQTLGPPSRLVDPPGPGRLPLRDEAVDPPAPSPPPTVPPSAPAVTPVAPRSPVPAPVDAAETSPIIDRTPVASTRTGSPIRVAPPAQGLFGLAPAPFLEGDFVAALRLANGRWAVVQPAVEPFPNAWQRRLILWFAVAFAIVAPLGWLFARRLVKPLAEFASAAEQLGRNPAGAVVALDGPAEIGGAAHAFNLMQHRLRSFVDDRTAMVGAISHDLRTPLTRLRFRIEDVPDSQRDGMLGEVEEMEAMIASVLEFIRDASTPNMRERLDLRTLVDDVVEDATLVGGDVTVEPGDAAPVEIDVLGMRRVLDNLLENAVKYGERARVRIRVETGMAYTDIIDDGPGLPDDELERVFEPFYRSDAARSSGTRGSGLGLAVCRSIARAHSGDVILRRAADGFVAQLRIPLAENAP